VEHVVFFPTAEGTTFRRLPSLEEAVRLVEHLRNVEGVGDVSLHALTEVPLAFRAYYRVEVPTAVVAAVQAPVPAQPVPAPAEAAPAPLPLVAEAAPAPALALVEDAAEPEPEVSALRGKDTPASLGFFA
jgi:hypothetical protein